MALLSCASGWVAQTLNPTPFQVSSLAFAVSGLLVHPVEDVEEAVEPHQDDVRGNLGLATAKAQNTNPKKSPAT